MLLNENGTALDDDSVVPPLSEDQKKQAEERTSVSAAIIHETVRRDGDEELLRPTAALAWSGLAAGLSMGFSFLAEGLIHSHLPDARWRPLLVNLGYPLGFLLVVIGRQQLFTENTLTAIIPLLARRNWRTFFSVARLWAIVLVANIVGAHLFAWALAHTGVVQPDTQRSLGELAKEAAGVGFGAAIVQGIFAGWLIAMMVWLRAAVTSGEIAVIVILTYAVGIGQLTHIIAGSVEVLYLVATDGMSEGAYLGGYMLPTLIGNVIGGTALVSALNHAQVVAGHGKS